MTNLRRWIHPTGLIFAAWLLISGVCLWVSAAFYECPPILNLGYIDTPNYPALLQQHSWRVDLGSPIVVLGISAIVGLLLLSVTKRWVYSLMLIPLACFGLITVFGSYLCAYGKLNHLETVEFDGKLYHLAMGEESAGIDHMSFSLLLYECTTSIERCWGRQLAQRYNVAPTAGHFAVDRAARQLSVIVDGEPLFTLDASETRSTLPQTLEPITRENVTEIQPLMRLQYDTIFDLSWSPDGNALGAAGMNGRWIHLFVETLVSTRMTVGDYRSQVEFSAVPTPPDVDWVRNVVLFWNVESDTERVTAVSTAWADFTLSRDGRLFALERELHADVYDLNANTTTPTFSVDVPYRIDELSFSPDGRLLALSGDVWNIDSENSMLEVWELATGERVYQFSDTQVDNANKARFDSHSQRVAFATTQRIPDDQAVFRFRYEHQIYVWDVAENTEVISFVVAHNSYEISSLMWSLDDNLLITSDPGGTIDFWDAQTGESVHSLSGDYPALALSPDGMLLAAGSEDGIRIWGIPVEEQE